MWLSDVKTLAQAWKQVFMTLTQSSNSLNGRIQSVKAGPPSSGLNSISFGHLTTLTTGRPAKSSREGLMSLRLERIRETSRNGSGRVRANVLNASEPGTREGLQSASSAGNGQCRVMH